MEFAEKSPAWNHLHTELKGRGWRVPVEGSLEEIMGRYQQHMNVAPLNQYDEVIYVREAVTRRPRCTHSLWSMKTVITANSTVPMQWWWRQSSDMLLMFGQATEVRCCFHRGIWCAATRIACTIR